MKLFVYGTLRHGFGLHDLIEGALGVPVLSGKAKPVKARTLGRLHYHAAGYYPVLLPDLAGLVHGEVYDLPFPNPDTEAIIRLETGAGYDMEERLVVTDLDRITTDKVWMFTWPDQGWRVGEPVPGNDWANAERRIYEEVRA
jgi:gamma-glutamylcyclotransferase (GGCT)/AIG2-like uncharacterized protein YtfP